MADIDPVMFGQMMAELKATRVDLNTHRVEMASLTARIHDLENKYRVGKAGVVGIVFGLGFAIFGIKETIIALWKAWL